MTGVQAAVIRKAQADAGEICAPGAAVRDETGAFPSREIRELAARGWLGMRCPRADGGQELDAVVASHALVEISRACASIGLLVGFHSFLVSEAVAAHAHAGSRVTLLPALARGERLGAAAFADPPASRTTHAAAHAARAPGGYVLNGEKAFAPGAIGADLFLVYAFSDEGSPRPPRDRLLVLIPRYAAGLEIGPPDRLVGVRASGCASLKFRDCFVPGENALGGPDQGRSLAHEILASADLVVAAQAVGVATAAFEKAVERATQRERRGSIVGASQGVQFKLADMLTSLEAARLFLLRAATARQEGRLFAYKAAQAKVFAGRAAVRIADEAIQIHGGEGFLAEHGIERHWRDAKTTELNPSTREATELWVARHLLEASP